MLILPFLYRKLHGFLKEDLIEEIEKGCIQADRVYECYEAKMHGCKVSSIVGQDLSNGDECKLRTTWLNPKTSRAQISLSARDTKHKTGNILLGVVNKETMHFDRLKLPVQEAYVPGKALSISWSIKGKGYGKYNKYLISSEPLG
jgi:hypothetical protein